MKPKKLLSFLLAAMMIFSLLPMSVFAEIGDGYGQCPHHTEHTAECGFLNGGTCNFICETCLKEVKKLVAQLPAIDELKQITQDKKSELEVLVDEIDHKKLNLSDAGREQIDWTGYDAACVVLTMPEGYFGVKIRKGYLESEEKPIPQFAFLNEQGERTQALNTDLQVMDVLSLDENLSSDWFYLPAGTYTVEEIVDGDWNFSLTVDGEPSPDLTFTGIEGSIRILIGDNTPNIEVLCRVITAAGDSAYWNNLVGTPEKNLLKAVSYAQNNNGRVLEIYKDMTAANVTLESGNFDVYAFNHTVGTWRITTENVKLLSGTFNQITVGDNMTLASILKEGYCFVRDGAVVDSTLKTAENVTVVKLEKNITLKTSALSGYDSTNGYKYVYYGTYNNESVKWRVLDMAYKYNKDNLNQTGMLVLSENALAKTQFGTTSTWNGSMVQAWCDDMYNSSFGTSDGTKEKDFILRTTSADNILSNDYLFFLSCDEAYKSEYFPDQSNRIAYLNGNAVRWWLRSPFDNYYGDCVDDDGDIKFGGVNSDKPAARPAFNLNPESVLFTSAKGIKAIDEGSIKKNENYVPDIDEKYEYKLTMVDTSRSGFSVDKTQVTGSKGQQITLSYSGAKTDDNEYVSAMIMNDDNDEVLYYGQGKKTVDENETSKGTVKFTLPDEIESGKYKLYVFNEQINGDKETDFSSEFQNVTLNVASPEAQVVTKTGQTSAGTLADMLEIAKANEDSTVTLLKDYTGNITINSGKFNFDAGEFSFNGTGGAFSAVSNIKIESNAELTITGGTFNLPKRYYAIHNRGILNITGGTFTNQIVNYKILNITGDAEIDELTVYAESHTVISGGQIKTLAVTYQNDDYDGKLNMPDIRINGGNFKKIQSMVTPGLEEFVEPQTFSEILAGGYAFKYKGDWIDGTLCEVGDENGTEFVTVEKIPIISCKTSATCPDVYGTPSTFRIYDIAVAEGYSPDDIAFEWKDNMNTVSSTTDTWSQVLAAGSHNVTCTMTLNGYSITKTFEPKTIAKKNISDAEITLGDSLTYNGTEQTQTVKEVKVGGLTLTENTDYTISNNTGTEAKTDYVLTITGKNNFSGTKTMQFSIAEAGSQTTVTPKNTSITYGDTLTLTATVMKSTRTLGYVDFYVGEDENAELLGSERVAYTDGTYGTATLKLEVTDDKYKKLEIGDNKITADYGGSVNLNSSKDDTISVTLETKTVGLTWENWDNLVYDGNQKTVSATTNDFVKGDNVSLNIEGENEKNAGTHTATASLSGEHAEYYTLLTTEKEYTIDPKTVTATISDIAKQTYTGRAITPQITAYDGSTLIPTSEYTVAYSNNENAGTATVTLTDNTGGNYTVSGSTTFTINPKPIVATISDIAKQTYTGRAITPQITAYDGSTLIPTSEYTVAYSNNENAGTATVTLTDNTGGNYTVSGSTTFTINPKPIVATISDIADQIYTGSEIEPTITVKDGDTTIPESEYTIDYSNNENAGTATVTLNDNTGGNYIVSGSTTFEILSKSIENATVALDGELTYNGQPQTQNVTLTLGGFTNVTFDVSDNKQTDVNANRNYTLTVTGTGNFTGTKTLDWNIKPYTPTENQNKKTTAIVKRGRTLADATVTNGEMLGVDGVTALEGTFVWADDTKAISADGTEQMTFTPTDTNYAPITFAVAVSTYSSGGGGGSSTSRYTVRFNTDGGNEITNQTVTKNSKSTEPAKPTKEGYIFDGWYTDSKFTAKYDFDTEVTKNITLYAKWVEDEVQEPSDDKKDDNTGDEQKPTTDEWKNPFADVTKADWFFGNIRYANENGLMSGVTSTEFAPNDSLTRAMLVTVLWRAEGEPVVNYAMPFTDIIDTAYYAEAVRWAASENIVNGVTETEFAPDENITREQIAAIIYRYAEYKGYDVSVGEDTNILSYTDFDEISEYAIEAIQYAVGMGLMKGKTENTLNPKDFATRAEIAAILNRFIEGNK